MWSDSLNVLFWIKNTSRSFKSFVANRVGELQRLTQPSQWRHVPGTENPADLVSRGVSAEELVKKTLWWSGPEFLCHGESVWPEKKAPTGISTDALSETKKSAATSCPPTLLTQPSQSDRCGKWRLNPCNFSSWAVLVRQMAWVIRFLENCRSPRTAQRSSSLSASEIADAEQLILKQAQMAAFPDDYQLIQKGKELPASSKLVGLSPFLDDNGILRMSGRLKNADFMSYDAKHPVILPRKGDVTLLIVRYYHQLGNHCSGVNHTMSNVLERYWIIAVREAIRAEESSYTVCKKQKTKPLVQEMAPLPKSRLEEPLRAFARVSVDFAGPFARKQGRGQRRAKRYLCLFTCLTS